MWLVHFVQHIDLNSLIRPFRLAVCAVLSIIVWKTKHPNPFHSNSGCVSVTYQAMALNRHTAVKCIIIWYNKAKTPKLNISFSLCACSFSTHHSALCTQKAESTKTYESEHWRSWIDEITKGTEEGCIWMITNNKQFLFRSGAEQEMTQWFNRAKRSRYKQGCIKRSGYNNN